MTEINNSNMPISSQVNFEGFKHHKKKLDTELTPEGEKIEHNINLEDDPNALYGRISVVPNQKQVIFSEATRESIKKSVEDFIEDPELVDLYVSLQDELIRAGKDPLDAMVEADYIIDRLKYQQEVK
ncbi:MAG: hypothetical protein E7Z91_00075 [Cyanobacteria bacterium SIG30]|nr:hypothetical protein [Cyanobacteria bacterium SIG30]